MLRCWERKGRCYDELCYDETERGDRPVMITLEPYRQIVFIEIMEQNFVVVVRLAVVGWLEQSTAKRKIIKGRKTVLLLASVVFAGLLAFCVLCSIVKMQDPTEHDKTQRQ